MRPGCVFLLWSQLGIFDGDLQLSNLVLKKQCWVLSPGISLSMEYGTIESFNVQIPWIKLHTGSLDVLVDNVHIIFKLNIQDRESEEDASRSSESFTQDFKMVSLADSFTIIIVVKNTSVLLTGRLKCVLLFRTGASGQGGIAHAGASARAKALLDVSLRRLGCDSNDLQDRCQV